MKTAQLYEGTEGLDESQLREMAWIGDALLSLFARDWLCQQGRPLDTDAFIRMTNNRFLATLGQPTRIEARIGIIYRKEGF